MIADAAFALFLRACLCRIFSFRLFFFAFPAIKTLVGPSAPPMMDTAGAHYVVTPNPEIVETCREDREALERDFAATTNVREMDVEAAQREILEKAEEAKKCM